MRRVFDDMDDEGGERGAGGRWWGNYANFARDRGGSRWSGKKRVRLFRRGVLAIDAIGARKSEVSAGGVLTILTMRAAGMVREVVKGGN